MGQNELIQILIFNPLDWNRYFLGLVHHFHQQIWGLELLDTLFNQPRPFSFLFEFRCSGDLIGIFVSNLTVFIFMLALGLGSLSLGLGRAGIPLPEAFERVALLHIPADFDVFELYTIWSLTYNI